MSKDLTNQINQLAELVEGLTSKLTLALDAKAPAKTVTTERRNAAGRLIDDKGRFLPETRKAAKAAKKAKEAKARAPKALCKSTRKGFIKAVKAEQGIDLRGWSTLDIAASVLAGEVALPEGFTIGEGYAKIVAERYDI